MGSRLNEILPGCIIMANGDNGSSRGSNNNTIGGDNNIDVVDGNNIIICYLAKYKTKTGNNKTTKMILPAFPFCL